MAAVSNTSLSGDVCIGGGEGSQAWYLWQDQTNKQINKETNTKTNTLQKQKKNTTKQTHEQTNKKLELSVLSVHTVLREEREAMLDICYRNKHNSPHSSKHTAMLDIRPCKVLAWFSAHSVGKIQSQYLTDSV